MKALMKMSTSPVTIYKSRNGQLEWNSEPSSTNNRIRSENILRHEPGPTYAINRITLFQVFVYL